jgi:hypothetical protein
LEKWRKRLIEELSGRPEGYTDEQKLVTGVTPWRLNEKMQAVHAQRLEEGFYIQYERPAFIPQTKDYLNTLN